MRTGRPVTYTTLSSTDGRKVHLSTYRARLHEPAKGKAYIDLNKGAELIAQTEAEVTSTVTLRALERRLSELLATTEYPAFDWPNA